MKEEPEDVMKSWVKNLVRESPEGTLAVPPREKKNQAVGDFEASLEGMKKILKDALKRNNRTYTMLVVVNLLMVGIGVGFVIVSIVYSVINHTINEITLSSSGLAVADFVAIFLVNPQGRIRSSLTNFVQLGIICHSWSSRTQASFILFLNSQQSAADVERFQKAIDEIADDAVRDIEERVEK